MNDFTKPAKRKRRLLEKDIQKKCVDYARSKGFWARKFSSMSQRSVPDYIFSMRRMFCETNIYDVKWAEEFKAPDKDVTAAQLEEHQLMRDAGWHVYRNTGMYGEADIEWFKARIDALEQEPTLAAAARVRRHA